MEQILTNPEKLKQIYGKVVEEPNKEAIRKRLIKCPECCEEILMVPTLKLMSTAIENHIHCHKEQLKMEPIRQYQAAIQIRLSLMEQVMEQAYRLQIS